jgi:hypothetical protein
MHYTTMEFNRADFTLFIYTRSDGFSFTGGIVVGRYIQVISVPKDKVRVTFSITGP